MVQARGIHDFPQCPEATFEQRQGAERPIAAGGTLISPVPARWDRLGSTGSKDLKARETELFAMVRKSGFHSPVAFPPNAGFT
jgi:hypothetical protein